MEINPTQQPIAQSDATTRPGSASLSSDFLTFLKMLTTQMQNQDPLNPVESSDFAVQLATFSGVEQQVQTNERLAGLSEQLSGSELSRVSGWIGMTAQAEAPIHLGEDPVPLHLRTDPEAEAARLVLRDSTGTAIQGFDVPAEGGRFAWAGVDEDGTPFAPGTYTAEILSFREGEEIATFPALVEARVAEARLRDGAAVLLLESGQSVATDKVFGLREADENGLVTQ